MNRSRIVVVVLILLLVAAGASLLKKRKADLARAPVARVLPVVVDTVVLRRTPVTLTLPAMGVVASELSATLSTKVSGRVLAVYKQEGDQVAKGDRLARIDDQDLVARKKALRSTLEGLEYELAVQRDSHRRTLELLKIGGVSPEQSQKEEAGIANLEKKIEGLRQNIKGVEALLSYTIITAPVCGTLSQRLVQAGDLATPGKPLFRIAACSGQYLNLSLPAGLKTEKILFQGQEIPLSAKNEASATGLTQYVAPLPRNAGVVEGQYLNVRVVVYQGDDILIPVDGLLSVGNDSFVFVRDRGKTVKTRVEIVARGSQGVVARPDLSGRTIILAKPDILLRASAGVPVQTMEQGGQKSGGGQSDV